MAALILPSLCRRTPTWATPKSTYPSQPTADVYSTDYYHSFQIQEFRRPEFEVKTRPESEGPFFIGGDATVSVHAGYFAGGPLPNAETDWNVSASPGSYSPPNWPDFTFGMWTPWWGCYEPYYDPYYGSDYTYSQLLRHNRCSRRPLSEHRLPDSE